MSNITTFEKIPTLAQLQEQGRVPEVVFWVGCAGSFDQKLQNITQSFAKILQYAKVDFAILGTEESCSGDPAKRAGNEFLFQLQAIQNIEIFRKYDIKKIVTTCPHCFNTFKNEYPILGSDFEVFHHSQFLEKLLEENKIVIDESKVLEEDVTYHDPCYLGRGNDIFDTPRNLIKALKVDIKEMKQNRKKSMCCGAGGAQIFKEPEKGEEDIHKLRAKEAADTKASCVVTSCPFCHNMMRDGISAIDNKEKEMRVYDLSEILLKNIKH